MIMNVADKKVGILDWPHKVASVAHRDFEEAAQTCLELGAQHLGLPFGVISSVHRNVFRVDKVFGRPPGLDVDDDGLWVKFEEYIAKHSLAQLSHGLCKPCVKELYGFDPDEVDAENCKCDGESLFFTLCEFIRECDD